MIKNIKLDKMIENISESYMQQCFYSSSKNLDIKKGEFSLKIYTCENWHGFTSVSLIAGLICIER